MGMSRGGGGGGGAAPAPAPVAQQAAAGPGFPDSPSAPASAVAPQPKVQQRLANYFRAAQVMGNPELREEFTMGAPSGPFLYQDGQAPKRPDVRQSVYGTLRQVGDLGVPPPSVSAAAQPTLAQTPIPGAGAPAARASALRRDDATAEVPVGATVQRQEYAADVMGGEPGVGEQGFGRRALVAGGGDLVDTMPPPFSQEQTDQVIATSNPDLLVDPNTPALGPSDSVAPDVNYIVPTSERENQLIAFLPNDPRAVAVARGPLSQNLVARRQTTGFGRNLMGM